MKDATLTWDYPIERSDGSPLPLSAISGMEISLSADLGSNFTVLGVVEAPGTEFIQTDLENGNWIFRLITIDTAGRRGTMVDHPFMVEEDIPPVPTAPPGPATNVQVVLS